tara:strand:- start:438 stop:767 length:330 start_codon:yes stop_codon:yes gene_type:complete
MQTLVIIFMTLSLFFLLWKKIIQIDISFFLFLALITLGIASLNDRFVTYIANVFNIKYEPIAIVFLSIFLLLCMIIMLVIAVSKLNAKHKALVIKVAELELGNLKKNND